MGLWGKPEDMTGYEQCRVEGLDEMTCWLDKKARERYADDSPSREDGDVVVAPEVGRIRWYLLDDETDPS